MNQLIIMLAIGSVLLVVGLLALVRMPKGNAAQQEPATLINIVALPSLEFKHPSLIFSDADYRTLSSEPRLLQIARTLKSDRRRMALQWLRLLQADVLSLWRLRRLLASYGVSQGMRAELGAAIQAFFMVVFLYALRSFVFFFGPFACAGIVATVRRHAEGLFRACGAALGHLPENRWNQFSDEWRAFQTHIA